MQNIRLLGTPEYTKAIALWHQGRFWEVHEVLEPLWRRLCGMERELTHGIILLAAALHKSQSSPRGGWRNFHKALRHLDGVPAIYEGILVAELTQETKRALKTASHRPDFPLL